MSNLAETLARLCAEHDLKVISIGINLHQSEAYRFDGMVQWGEYHTETSGCTSENAPTPEAALHAAIAKARTLRGMDGVRVPELEIDA